MRRRVARKIMITDALVRYNDDIRDLFMKLKNKIKEAIASFKSLPSGKKIAFIFSRILTLVGGFVTGKNAVHAVQAAKEIRGLFNKAENIIEIEVQMPGESDWEPVQSKSFFTMLKSNPSFYKPLLKTIGGLIMAICGYVLDTYAKA